MEEFKITAIVISSIDYKENDKLLHLFSLELGAINANLRGVKQAKSKLKFASMPFFVGEFFLVKTGNNYVVKTVNSIDSFYNITENYDKFLIASTILETVKLTMKENMINEQLFVSILKTLEHICYDDYNDKMLLIQYLIQFFKLNGYELNFSNCSICGIALKNDYYFNTSGGGFVCFACKQPYDLEVQKNVFSSLKILNQADVEKLNTVKLKDDILIQSLMILKVNFNILFKSNLSVLNRIIL